MDNIAVDAELHDKIMKQVKQKPAAQHRKRNAFRYAGWAACVAVILLCVWAVPGLLDTPDNSDKINKGDIYIASPDNPQNSGAIGTLIAGDPNGPANTAYPVYPLTLNKLISQKLWYRYHSYGKWNLHGQLALI